MRLEQTLVGGREPAGGAPYTGASNPVWTFAYDGTGNLASSVDPAGYAVRATVQGYKTFERKGIRIGTQQFIALDIQLEVGAIEETITVTGEAPLVETANASVGDVLDSRTLRFTPESGARAGYDGAKRKKGSKLHMAVDTLGHLLAAHVTPATADDPCRL